MLDILKSFDELFNQIWIFIQRYETLMGTIIGAYLAALFGILTQKYNNYSERKNQIKRYGRLLFYDFQNIYDTLTAIEFSIKYDKQNGTFDKNKIFKIAKERHWFNYNPQWREYLLQISEKIPDSYIEE